MNLTRDSHRKAYVEKKLAKEAAAVGQQLPFSSSQ
jgi:hypothetical protein